MFLPNSNLKTSNSLLFNCDLDNNSTVPAEDRIAELEDDKEDINTQFTLAVVWRQTKKLLVNGFMDVEINNLMPLVDPDVLRFLLRYRKS